MSFFFFELIMARHNIKPLCLQYSSGVQDTSKAVPADTPKAVPFDFAINSKIMLIRSRGVCIANSIYVDVYCFVS